MVWTTDDDNHYSSMSGEEAKCDGDIVGNGVLKKGPWTLAEDLILTEYVKKHGEGNWNAVQKVSGLSRCGKSCRLRWVNHLRPDLKKGAFTQEEEDIIIKLHAKLGNKWARMVAELPGRTDNEIKNFWNTRIKRLKRAGIKIYPDDVLNLSNSNESQQSQVSGIFSNEHRSSHNLTEAGLLDIPLFKIEHSLCSELYSSKLFGLPTNNVLPEDLVPSCDIQYLAPIMFPRKQLRESYASHGLSDTDISSHVNQWNCNDPFQHHQQYDLPPFTGSFCGDDSSLHVLPGSHALINGTHSTSDPKFGSDKLELPSIQSSDTDYSFWDAPPSPLASLECTDTSIQPPQTKPSYLQGAPDTNGLLESVVWPPNEVNTSKVDTNSMEKAAIGVWDEDLFVDFSVPEWEVFADHIRTVDSSIEAIFSDLQPPDTMRTDKLQPTDAMLDSQGKRLNADPKTPPSGTRSSNQNHYGDSYPLDSSRPDTWLNANLSSIETELGKDFLELEETISALIGDKNHLYQQL